MKRKIPKKNYIILIILSLITLLLTFFLVNKYKDDFYDNKIKFVSEIKENEINDYAREGHEIIIYMSNSKNRKLRKLEKDLKKYTEQNDLKEKFVYLDLYTVSNNFNNEFYVKFINESYNGSFEIKDPTIVIIDNEKVKTFTNDIKNIDDIKEFFNNNGVLE